MFDEGGSPKTKPGPRGAPTQRCPSFVRQHLLMFTVRVLVPFLSTNAIGQLSDGEIEPAGPLLRFSWVRVIFTAEAKVRRQSRRRAFALGRKLFHLFASMDPNSAEFCVSTTHAIAVSFQRSALHIVAQLYLKLYCGTSICSRDIHRRTSAQASLSSRACTWVHVIM